jgi:pimeloyl-ACP methyl ester carboxylesterase
MLKVMQVVVNSLMTSYEKTGSGKTVLFLHGWGDSKEGFKELASELSKHFTVVAVDLPGFGGTEAPEDGWGIGDYIDFVDGFIKKIGVAPYAVIGHSNGGAIAIRGLGSKKLSAQRLVLLGSAGVRNTYKARKKILRLAAKAAKIATYPLPKRVQNKIKKKAYKTVGSELFVAEHMQETFKKVVTDDVQADAAKLTLPTLLIYGANDTATPPSYGKSYNALISGSELHVLPDAGHFVHHDRPNEVRELVKEFLQ